MIRKATSDDANSILEIYSYYVRNTIVSFELEPPTLEVITQKISNSVIPWLVFEEDNKVIGYAYATKWKEREAYKRSVETSIYFSNDFKGRGYGKVLYLQLIEMLKKAGFHAIIGGISLPNDRSVRLHESMGFEKIAQFKEVGYKFDKWIDVGYWEFIID